MARTHALIRASLPERLAWRAFVALGGKYIARAICARIDRRAEKRDPPDFRSSPYGVILLRKRSEYRDVRHVLPWMWQLPDDILLGQHAPVFELDLCSRAAEHAKAGCDWHTLIISELSSLIPVLQQGPEVAVVARTTHYRQLARLGFANREVPHTPHRYGDALLRQFYVLAHEPKGVRRVVEWRMDFVRETAVSTARLVEKLERISALRRT